MNHIPIKVFLRLSFVIVGLAVGGMVTAVKAATIALDTTTINFSASGSPNTISGSWNALPLLIDDQGSLEFFTIELTSFVSPFVGSHNFISLDSGVGGATKELRFCSQNPGSCLGLPTVGNLITISGGPFGTFAHEWEFLVRLIQGNTPFLTSGGATVGFWLGGGPTTATGTFSVTAYGTAPIPLPAALPLMAGGLGLLGLLGWRRKRLATA